MKRSQVQSPLVSVIIPFYNLEGSIPLCLESVLRQTYENIEVVCVDDGSQDGTLGVLRKYANLDPRVIVYQQQNSGQAEARNNGVARSSGEYITFVDGDDYIAPNYIERLLEGAIASEGVLAIVGYGDIAFENLPVSSRDLKGTAKQWRASSVSDLLYRDLVSCCWGRMAQRSLFESNPLRLRYYEDVEVGGRYLSGASGIAFLDEKLYFHVRRPGSTVNVKIPPLEQVQDYVFALEGQLEELQGLRTSEDAIAYSAALHWSRIYKLASRAARCAAIDAVRKRAISEVRARIRNIMFDDNVSLLGKARLLVLAALPSLYNVSFDLFIRLKTMLSKKGN